MANSVVTPHVPNLSPCAQEEKLRKAREDREQRKAEAAAAREAEMARRREDRLRHKAEVRQAMGANDESAGGATAAEEEAAAAAAAAAATAKAAAAKAELASREAGASSADASLDATMPVRGPPPHHASSSELVPHPTAATSAISCGAAPARRRTRSGSKWRQTRTGWHSGCRRSNGRGDSKKQRTRRSTPRGRAPCPIR